MVSHDHYAKLRLLCKAIIVMSSYHQYVKLGTISMYLFVKLGMISMLNYNLNVKLGTISIWCWVWSLFETIIYITNYSMWSYDHYVKLRTFSM